MLTRHGLPSLHRRPPSPAAGAGATSGPNGRVRHGSRASRSIVAVAAGALCLGTIAATMPAGAAATPFLAHMHSVTNIASTVPPNGDLNPYGIVTVPVTSGALVQGDTLISNFNAMSNLQGTGTTLVEISSGHHVTVFAQLNASEVPGCTGGVGLTTALTVLNDGFVVVGSLPVTANGTGSPQAGCLIVLNSNGIPVETWSGNGIDGPWDLTAAQFGGFAELFVTNVLNGISSATPMDSPVNQGTVLRLDVAMPTAGAPVLMNTTPIGMGFAEELDPTALVIGPTGVALGPDDTLYVADTVNSRIAAIASASTRTDAVMGGGPTVSMGDSLKSPLGLTLAPNGDLVTVNGGDGNGVEVTPAGTQVVTVQFDPAGAGGDLFGLTIAPNGRGVLFVDDGDNTLKLLH